MKGLRLGCRGTLAIASTLNGKSGKPTSLFYALPTGN